MCKLVQYLQYVLCVRVVPSNMLACIILKVNKLRVTGVLYIVVSLVHLVEFLHVSQLGHGFLSCRALAARKPQGCNYNIALCLWL